MFALFFKNFQHAGVFPQIGIGLGQAPNILCCAPKALFHHLLCTRKIIVFLAHSFNMGVKIEILGEQKKDVTDPLSF